MVNTIDVKDAANATKTVATMDALIALIGEVQASPTANTALARLKDIATALGASFSHDITATITRQANTTAYDAGDVVGQLVAALTFTGASRTGGGATLINGVTLKLKTGTLPATAWRLHLYAVTPPSAPADAATFDVPSGDRDAYLGYIDIPAAVDLGSTCFVAVNNLGMQLKFNSANCYGLLQTISGYTPGSGDVYEITLHTSEV